MKKLSKELKVKVSTLEKDSFMQLGPIRESPIATEITDFNKISIGKGYVGFIVRNPIKKLWHIFQADCGCCIGTCSSRSEVIVQVLKDVKYGNQKIMKQQIIQGKTLTAKAKMLKPEIFFSKFTGELRKGLNEF